jgi:hypothetical protein
MKQAFFITIILWLSLAVYSQDMDLKAIEELKISIKKTTESDISATEKEKNIKLWFNKAINVVDLAKSHYTETYQFDKAKRATEILAQLKEGKSDIDIKVEEVKKDEVVKEKAGPAVRAYLKKLFPEGLIDKDGKAVNLSDLNGKVVGIFFASRSNKRSRRFTNTLMNLRDENKDIFEVVFVSKDDSESDKTKFMTDKEMKWPTVKFNGDCSKNLNTKFKPSNVPSLIIISKSGEIINNDACDEISSDRIKSWIKER